MVGPDTEKVHPPSFVFVLTVSADLVVDDLSRLRLNKRNEVPQVCWTAMVKDIVHTTH